MHLKRRQHPCCQLHPKIALPGKIFSRQDMWDIALAASKLQMFQNLAWTHKIASGALETNAKPGLLSRTGSAPSVLAKVLRSKSKIACAMRHICACKAKKFYVVPKEIAMDGKISNNKVFQMQLTKFVPWMESFALFAMFAKVEDVLRSGLATNVVCPNPIAFARNQRQQKPGVHVNVQQLHCQARSCQHQKEQQPESRRYVKPAKGRLNLC